MKTTVKPITKKKLQDCIKAIKENDRGKMRSDIIVHYDDNYEATDIYCFGHSWGNSSCLMPHEREINFDYFLEICLQLGVKLPVKWLEYRDTYKDETLWAAREIDFKFNGDKIKNGCVAKSFYEEWRSYV